MTVTLARRKATVAFHRFPPSLSTVALHKMSNENGLLARLRELGDGMEVALSGGAVDRFQAVSTDYTAKHSGPGRPPATTAFWSETVRTVGALLQQHQTANLQREQLFETLRMWEKHQESDLMSPRPYGAESAPLSVSEVRGSMRKRADRLTDIHVSMTRQRDGAQMAEMMTMTGEVRSRHLARDSLATVPRPRPEIA